VEPILQGIYREDILAIKIRENLRYVNDRIEMRKIPTTIKK
jgi:hypothetical protein